MTEFDLRALGWVVTRDVLWEVVRSLTGRTSRLPLPAMRGLSQKWQTLTTAAGKTSQPVSTRIVSSSRSQAMSAEAYAAAAEYLSLLCLACPDLYSPDVLRDRCWRASVQSIAGLGGAAVLGLVASPGFPFAADIALVLFAMGSWGLVTFLQLRRVHKLVAQLAAPSSC